MTPDTLIEDSPIIDGVYRPKNSSERYRGKITLKQAFAQSSNVAAVRLYRQLGDKAIIKAARDLGINSPLAADDPSLALGTSGVTLLELTSAYASVAANNAPVEASAFHLEQESGWFDWLTTKQRSLGSANHDNLEEMLRAVVQSGTGRAAALRIPAFGKTGTSQDNRDALFIGYAGDLVVGVWVGKDDNSPLKGVNGGGLPARIWRDFMAQAVKGAAPVAPPKPVAKPDPEGPVEPLDLPEIPEIPVNIEGTDVRINGNKGVTVSTDIGGVPIDLTLDKNGLDVKQREKRPREGP
jgi:penicillin-binding protein 1A